MSSSAAFILSPSPSPFARTDIGARTGLSPSLIAGALLLSALLMVVLLAHAGLVIDPWSRGAKAYLLAGAIAAVLRFGIRGQGWRGARALGDAAGYMAAFVGIGLMGAVTSYPIAALTHGYADPTLQRFDLALRFDWLAWYRLVADHRALQWLGMVAYQNIYATPAVLLGWFAWHGDRRAAHRFLAGFWLAGIITLALFSLMPAVGPFSYLWHGAIPYMPVSELWQPDLIPALRAHTVHVVDPGQLRGIVSAPSFHAASAVIYIATACRVPVLRRPLLWANAAMLLATPVEGTHYLSDMLMGAMVALVALAGAQRLLPAVAD